MNCRKIAVFRCFSGLWLFFYFKCLTRTIISLKILYSPLDNSIKLNYDRALFGGSKGFDRDLAAGEAIRMQCVKWQT